MNKRRRLITLGFVTATILMVPVAYLLCIGPRLYTVTVLPSLGG